MLPWIREHESLIPSAIRRLIPSDSGFIAYAGIFFLALYLIAGLWAIRSRRQSIPWIVLATLVVARLENAGLHTIESVALMQYTPGVLTAVLVVLPITVYLLTRMVKLGLIRAAWLPRIALAGFVEQSSGIGAMFILGSV